MPLLACTSTAVIFDILLFPSVRVAPPVTFAVIAPPRVFNSKLSELFEIPNRLPEEPINDIHRNIAAALQNTYEFLFFRLLDKLQVESKSKNLCLSGGCAYNGTANGKILERTKFKQLWIPPAPSIFRK